MAAFPKRALFFLLAMTVMISVSLFFLETEAFSNSDSHETPNLIEPNKIAEDKREEVEAELHPEALRTSYVEVNEELLFENLIRKGDLVGLKLFPDLSFDVKVGRVMSGPNGMKILNGKVQGDEMAYVRMTFFDNRLMASIRFNQSGEYYRVFYREELGSYLVLQEDPDQKEPSRGAPPLIPDKPGKDEEEGEGKKKIDPPERGSSMRGKGGPAPEVDVMVVYTPAAKDSAQSRGVRIEDDIGLAMAFAQQSADNSDIDMNFNLVASKEVDYQEVGEDLGLDLRRLSSSEAYNWCGNEYTYEECAGYMDEVHEWRKEYGADLVALFISDGDFGGRGWRPSRDLHIDPYAGFTVTVGGNSEMTHAHEMGHNLGAGHSRKQESNPVTESSNLLYDYATGWRWPSDTKGYVSVMTYEEGGHRVPYFSNPNVKHSGEPTGSYSGPHAPADNAELFRFTAPKVADYMERPELLSPKPNEVIPTGNVHFQWKPLHFSDAYQIQVSSDSNFSEGLAVNDQQFFSSDSYDSPTLEGDETYWWRVRSKKTSEMAPWSKPKKFEVDSHSGEGVALSYPPKNAESVSREVNFEWSEEERGQWYELEVSRNENFFSPKIEKGHLESASFGDFARLEPETQYFWRVRVVYEGLHKGDWSEAWSFETEDGTFLAEKEERETAIQNHPNPFTYTTEIQYHLPESGQVQLNIYDITGQKITTLLDERQSPGEHRVSFDGSSQPEGMYFYRLKFGDKGYTGKMMLQD